jgi:site-specific DNA-methyltransferase (cytosine-N4-specific)
VVNIDMPKSSAAAKKLASHPRRKRAVVKEDEQLYLVKRDTGAEALLSPKEKNLRAKITVIPIDYESEAQRSRARLEKKYRDLFQVRPEARRLVTYVLNKHLPVYNWFKFKEGFSRQLVVELIAQFQLSKKDFVFDPFAGCGTTLLTCKELGISAAGIDVLPTSAFVAKVKLLDWHDLDELLSAVQQLMAVPFREPRIRWPNVRIINLAFTPEVQSQILFFKEEIDKFTSPIRDFLMLGLLSILEAVSRTSKDGQFLRLVEKSAPPVRDALRAMLSTMVSDLSQQQQTLFKAGKVRVNVSQGDARDEKWAEQHRERVAAIITSPPYLNRYDYSRTYALELCLLTVKSHREMVDVRHSLLRSHVESREHTGKEIRLPALDELLLQLAQKDLNNNRLPVMVQGYFEDMNLVIKNMTKSLKRGGRVALVVANAQFAGENVPVDLMLSELAEQHGLTTEEIWVTRFKGNSSQQMAIYGRRPVRESIVFWRKNG